MDQMVGEGTGLSRLINAGPRVSCGVWSKTAGRKAPPLIVGVNAKRLSGGDGQDRRNKSLKVPCKTSGSIENIEDWLDDNCDNDWNVVLQKVTQSLETKHLLVMFETEADRDRFLDKYLKRND